MRGRADVGMDDHRGDAHHPVQPVFESSERQTVNDPRVYGSQRRFYDPAAADVVTCHKYGWCVAVAPDTLYLHYRKSVVSGKSVSGRLDLGGRRHIKKKT